MPEFLNVLTYAEAHDLLKRNFPLAACEDLRLEDCLGRILGSDIASPEDIPAFNRSTVDGYAVKAEDTFGSSENLPGMLEFAGAVEMGERADYVLGRGQCVWMPTGGMLPEGTDAVVMVEYSERLDDSTILISRPVAPGENVMHKGEDVQQGKKILSRGTILWSQQIGLLASLGITTVTALKSYRIAVLSTGNEIIPIEEKPQLGQVRDVNSYALAAALSSCGALVSRYPIISDDLESLRLGLDKALAENDLVIISGGSSVGIADYSVEVMMSFPGAQLLFHGIAVKPGKPTIGVKVGEKLIIGLPGHPVSALMVFHILCADLINPVIKRSIEAVSHVNIASQAGRDDFIPVQLTQTDIGWNAVPLLGKSGLMSILALADGYLHIAYEKQGIAAGDKIEVNLF
jgi:molybdopterin molybdotransferase